MSSSLLKKYLFLTLFKMSVSVTTKPVPIYIQQTASNSQTIYLEYDSFTGGRVFTFYLAFGLPLNLTSPYKDGCMFWFDRPTTLYVYAGSGPPVCNVTIYDLTGTVRLLLNGGNTYQNIQLEANTKYNLTMTPISGTLALSDNNCRFFIANQNSIDTIFPNGMVDMSNRSGVSRSDSAYGEPIWTFVNVALTAGDLITLGRGDDAIATSTLTVTSSDLSVFNSYTQPIAINNSIIIVLPVLITTTFTGTITTSFTGLGVQPGSANTVPFFVTGGPNR